MRLMTWRATSARPWLPAASAAQQRWRTVDLVLALTPLVLLVQPIMAIMKQRAMAREEAEEGDDVVGTDG